MDLKKFKFPEPTMMLPTNKELLAEAKSRGFYDGGTPYNDLFSKLFFSGGNLKFKEGLDKEFAIPAFSYLKAFMGTFNCAHEEKEAVCAMLLSELVDL